MSPNLYDSKDVYFLIVYHIISALHASAGVEVVFEKLVESTTWIAQYLIVSSLS